MKFNLFPYFRLTTIYIIFFENMKNHKCSLVLFVILLCTMFNTLLSQENQFQPIDSLIQLIEDNNRGMGSLAIRKNGTLVYSKAFGKYSIDSKTAKNSNTQTGYRIGSVSKMFTAVIIFQLIEEGKLTLETPLSTYFPNFKNSKKITISMLLNHRSGIHNFTDDADYQYYMQTAKSKKELLEIMIKKGVDFDPDEKAAYSNSNYILLGYIAEEVTKKKYAELVTNRIVDKLDLKRTYLGEGIKESKNEAQSYMYIKNKYVKTTETHPSIAYSAGSLVSTSEELTLFIDGLFTEKLISKSSFEKMVELKENYGRGIFRYPYDNSWLFGHTGGIDNFQSMLAYDPEEAVSVSYCANAVSYPTNDILLFVLSQVYKKGVMYPNFGTIDVDEAILKTYIGEYTTDKMALKITISVKDGKLFAQASGQDEFSLDAINETTFEFPPARILMEFNTTTKTFKFEQSGVKMLFRRK